MTSFQNSLSSQRAVTCLLQRLLTERDSQIEQQVGMNQQLMKRKEDMEWQLMSVLAKVCQFLKHGWHVVRQA